MNRLIMFSSNNAYIAYIYIYMIPMHLMIQRQRLKLFGHIIRMTDDRHLKQLLFRKIDGLRFRGRPNMRWIDCIIIDWFLFLLRRNNFYLLMTLIQLTKRTQLPQMILKLD